MKGRLLRPTLLAAVIAATVPAINVSAGLPTGDNLAACEVKGQVSIRKDGWARIAAPAYGGPAEQDVITDFAAPIDAPKLAWVTNGDIVQASSTAGCKWSHVYAARPFIGETGSPEKHVVTRLLATTGTVLWITGYDLTADGVERPFVKVSPDARPGEGNDAAKPFGAVQDGLPPVGRPLDLEVSSRDQRRAFLLLQEPDLNGPVRRLYRLDLPDQAVPVPEEAQLSESSWETVTPPEGFGAIEGVTLGPKGVYIWSGDTYAFSEDRGTTWKKPVKTAGRILALDVNALGTAAIFSAVADGAAVMRLVKSDGGILREEVTPVAPVSAAHGSRSNVYAISGERGTYGHDFRSLKWVKVTPTGAGPFRRMQFGITEAGARILIGQTENALYRFDLFLPERFEKTVGTGGPIDDDDERFPNSSLVKDILKVGRPPVIASAGQTAQTTVTVRPGQTADVPVSYQIPPGANPVDVFFLVDTTMSMATAIKGLQEGVVKIAKELKERTRGSACFGVGDFKDFNPASSSGDGVTKVYQRHARMSCEIEDVEKAVKLLKQSGGDGVEAEAQTIALTQAVTGNGSVAPGPVILPELDAKFSAPNRVIVLITDSGFKTRDDGYGGYFPTIDETVAALQGHGRVKVVSVHVLTNNEEREEAHEDMAAVSAGTDTFAPEDGVDCDGDGVFGPDDLQAGEPLVCATENESANIAPAIVSLLLGVKDPQKVEVGVDDPHKVVAAVHGPTAKIANLKVESHLDFSFSATCAPEQDGLDLPVTLRPAKADVLTGITAKVIVQCRALPVPPVPPVVQPEPVFEAPIPPRPPQPPVVPPQLPPNPPPQPPANLNPNAGFSQQEEEQSQLATVTQTSEEQQQDEEAVELALSAVDRHDPAAAPIVLGGATLLTAAAGAVLAHRRRTQQAQAVARATG